jgi:anhydro-N-acetylmuramic acid kinase
MQGATALSSRRVTPHPIDRVRARLTDGSAVVAGVLSGTSADGIDVALVRFDGADAGGPLRAPRTLAFHTLPFEPELGRRVRAVLDGAPTGLREAALLSRELGTAFGRAARELADAHGLALDLAGSHGQTVWHHDGREALKATLQLGDGDFAAEAAGCAVASDFRQRDLAAGGEGAPISALADDLLFLDLPRPAAVLNLGGMANLTLLASLGAPARAFDVGPANSLLDGLSRRLLDRPYDQDGAAALAGSASARLLDELLAHEFLRRAPPKSTGRDTFGEAWVDSVVERARSLGVARAEDLLATAADFVAAACARALAEHGGPGLQWLVVCGGGARHARVVDRLALRAPQPVASSADFGVDPDAREALVFAVLAARCALAHPSTEPAATGAARGRVLGKLSWP